MELFQALQWSLLLYSVNTKIFFFILDHTFENIAPSIQSLNKQFISAKLVSY